MTKPCTGASTSSGDEQDAPSLDEGGGSGHDDASCLAAADHDDHAEEQSAADLPPCPDCCRLPDIEDTTTAPAVTFFDELHAEACQRGDNFYTDPVTGFKVFTQVAHERRGKCCGSGCRHCPYSHVNVKDKALRIQQPAILYRNDDPGSRFAVCNNLNVRVLFFSSGKDSFLALRKLVRQAKQTNEFGIVLLTTFDATSRIIAHQDVHIRDVERQAKHLGVTALVAVPMNRKSQESYVTRVQRGLDIIITELLKDGGGKIHDLVFGDLHLDHVYFWRQSEMKQLGYTLEFPLWKADYNDLETDLIKSGIRCVVSSSNFPDLIQTGEVYNQALRDRIKAFNKKHADNDPGAVTPPQTESEQPQPPIDVFGENGEFHTIAEVWVVPQSQALGLDDEEC